MASSDSYDVLEWAINQMQVCGYLDDDTDFYDAIQAWYQDAYDDAWPQDESRTPRPTESEIDFLIALASLSIEEVSDLKDSYWLLR